MNWQLIARYFLEFAMIYPAALLCYLPVRKHLRVKPGKVVLACVTAITLFAAGGSLLCAALDIDPNILLMPALLLAFAAYRYTLSASLHVGKLALAFCAAGALMGACVSLTAMLTAQREVFNEVGVFLASSSLLCLGISAAVSLVYWLFAARRIAWLIDEIHSERIWRIAWMIPAFFMSLYVFMLPNDPATVLVNRVQMGTVTIACVSLLVLFFLVHLFY